MTSTFNKRYYTGRPQETRIPIKLEQLPYVDLEKATDPKFYIAPSGLRDAVNVALELGLPLLLTGEPGVGKSMLAHSLNYELGYEKDDLIHFTVKSDTRDSELFYNYDTLGRFHAVHGQINITDEAAKQKAYAEADPKRFIRYQGLGKAILLAKGKNNIPDNIITPDELKKFPDDRRRAVVLIDEIDKAPRDMPNDILNEIERMEFSIPELFWHEPIKLETAEDKSHRPIVIITSNAECELPEAFLRRCLYYHLTMPPFKKDLDHSNAEQEVTIEYIVNNRLGNMIERKKTLSTEALSLFRFLRDDNQSLQRKPSLAELLDWLRYLDKNGDAGSLIERKDFLISLQTSLLKNQNDQQKILVYVKDWQNKN